VTYRSNHPKPYTFGFWLPIGRQRGLFSFSQDFVANTVENSQQLLLLSLCIHQSGNQTPSQPTPEGLPCSAWGAPAS
jgi:hypothetical protein